MTIDQIETSEDTAKGLLVTDAAVEKVLEARSEEEESEKLALRVQIIGVNGPEFSYDLSSRVLTKPWTTMSFRPLVISQFWSLKKAMKI